MQKSSVYHESKSLRRLAVSQRHQYQAETTRASSMSFLEATSVGKSLWRSWAPVAPESPAALLRRLVLRGEVGRHWCRGFRVPLAALMPTRWMPRRRLESPKEVYTRRWEILSTWCSRRRTGWSNAAQPDTLLDAPFDELFRESYPVDHAHRLLAVLALFWARLCMTLETPLVPRARRAVGALWKLAPPNQWLPTALVVLRAIMGFALWPNLWTVNANLMFQYWTHLRPWVCDFIKVDQLVDPQCGAGLPLWAVVLKPVDNRTPGMTELDDQSLLWDAGR